MQTGTYIFTFSQRLPVCTLTMPILARLLDGSILLLGKDEIVHVKGEVIDHFRHLLLDAGAHILRNTVRGFEERFITTDFVQFHSSQNKCCHFGRVDNVARIATLSAIREHVDGIGIAFAC
jgi:hypothetical protein